MTTFQQTCPACFRQLELPGEADGQSAICPACDSEFIASASDSSASDSSVSVATPEQDGSAKSFRSVTIDSILTESRMLLADRCTPLFWPFMLPMLLLMIGFVLPVASLSSLATSNQDRALTLLGVFSPLLLLPVAYASWVALFLVNRLLDTSKDDQTKGLENDFAVRSSERHWAIPEWRTFFAVYLGVVVAAALIGALAAIAGMVIRMGGSIQVPEVRVLVIGFTFVVSSVGFVVVAMRLWPVFPLLMRSGVRRSVIRHSLELTRPNALSSFLLVASACSMLGMGLSLFGLGLPFAIPVVALLLTVALRLIDGSSIPALSSSHRL